MEYLDKSELRRFFKVAAEHNPLHHLFLVVSLWHGLRVSEAINIVGSDICDGQISVKRLKNSHATCQPIHHDADPLFDSTPILALAAKTQGRLFPFCRQRADQFVKKYAALAGIHPDKAHTHVLKHSIALLLWEKTHSLGQIQGYLGHKAAGSTLRYLVEVDQRKAQSAVAGISI